MFNQPKQMEKVVRQDHLLAQRILAMQVRGHHHHIKSKEKMKSHFKELYGVEYIKKQWLTVIMLSCEPIEKRKKWENTVNPISL